MELYRIFDRKQYSQAYAFAKENGYTIKRIGDNQYQIVEKTIIEQLEPTYVELRQQEYPPVEEQLDMLYWDKVNGTNDWADLITEIKEKYPKPAAETNNADTPETSISAENEADDQSGSGNNDTAEQNGNASLHEDDEEE